MLQFEHKNNMYFAKIIPYTYFKFNGRDEW